MARILSCSAIALAGALALAAPVAFAVHLTPADLNATHLVLVVVSQPDRQTPEAWFDAATRIAGLPVGEGGGANLETLVAYRDAYARRADQDPAGTLRIDALQSSGSLRVNVTGRASGWDALRAFVVEDPAAPAGREVPLRFLARATTEAQPANATTTFSFSLEPAWRPDRLGVVVFARDGNATQVGLWRAGQEGPTRQAAKAVLLELYTGPRCPECPVAERAAADLAAVLGPTPLDAPVSYLRGAPWWAWTAAGGGALGVWLMGRPRGRQGGGADGV
jgi:hypothetical protein